MEKDATFYLFLWVLLIVAARAHGGGFSSCLGENKSPMNRGKIITLTQKKSFFYQDLFHTYLLLSSFPPPMSKQRIDDHRADPHWIPPPVAKKKKEEGSSGTSTIGVIPIPYAFQATPTSERLLSQDNATQPSKEALTTAPYFRTYQGTMVGVAHTTSSGVVLPERILPPVVRGHDVCWHDVSAMVPRLNVFWTSGTVPDGTPTFPPTLGARAPLIHSFEPEFGRAA